MEKLRAIKIILLCVGFLALCMVFFALFIKDKVPPNIFCFLDIGKYKIPPSTVEINSSNICGQSFVANFDNLFMMSIFVPTQNLERDQLLYFHLKNSKDDDKDLVTLKWQFNQIRFAKNNFYTVPPEHEFTEKGFHFHFQFPPIRDSKDREFYFYFESPDAKSGEGIRLGVHDDTQYLESLTKGQMFINDNPIKGFLAFRTYCTWQPHLNQLTKEIGDRLLKDKTFLSFYILLMAIATLGLILSLKSIGRL